MRVLLTGATGAVGRPLTRQLLAAGHEVLALTRTEAGAREMRRLGAVPVVADALDADALLRALSGQRADAVIHQLTALKKMPLTMRGMAATNALRTRGTANLLAAARALGAHRFITQSIVLGYGYRDHGDRVLTEADPFGVPERGPTRAVVEALADNERQVFQADGIEGVALRYGLFYGPGTTDFATMLRRRMFPVPTGGGGVMSWIYIEDAASAAVAALQRGRPGAAYNIVDDEPVRWGDFLDAAAAAFGAPRPPRVPAWLLRPMSYGYAAMTASIRAANTRAREELGWAPSVPSYREGLRRMTADAVPRQ
jgi:nucleoside-diphosphate-sugar epimerase